MEKLKDDLAWMGLDIYSTSILALIMLVAFALCVIAIWKDIHD